MKSPKKSPKKCEKKMTNECISIDYILAHHELDTIHKGTLTVAAYPNFYPVCYFNKKKEIDGLDVHLIKKFASIVGLKVRFDVVDKFLLT